MQPHGEGPAQDRRVFLQTSAELLAAGLGSSVASSEQVYAAESAPDLRKAGLPQIPYNTLSTQAIFDMYAIELPDTPWRRAWNESYAVYDALRNELMDERIALSREHGTESPNYEAAKLALEEQAEKRMDEWRQNYASLESGGERIFDGNEIAQQLGLGWILMDCHTYCFEILRRGAGAGTGHVHYMDVNAGGIIGSLLMEGFYPVREPKDFDVVVYGSPVERDGIFIFEDGHYGMYKDGAVVSKDILSNHVYKHPVEESAAYSSHVMYFRHKTHPDPRAFPLPASAGDLSFRDVDGIATPVVVPYSGATRFLLKGALIVGASMVATKALSALRKWATPASDISEESESSADGAE